MSFFYNKCKKIVLILIFFFYRKHDIRPVLHSFAIFRIKLQANGTDGILNDDREKYK